MPGNGVIKAGAAEKGQVRRYGQEEGYVYRHREGGGCVAVYGVYGVK